MYAHIHTTKPSLERRSFFFGFSMTFALLVELARMGKGGCVTENGKTGVWRAASANKGRVAIGALVVVTTGIAIPLFSSDCTGALCSFRLYCASVSSRFSKLINNQLWCHVIALHFSLFSILTITFPKYIVDVDSFHCNFSFGAA